MISGRLSGHGAAGPGPAQPWSVTRTAVPVNFKLPSSLRGSGRPTRRVTAHGYWHSQGLRQLPQVTVTAAVRVRRLSDSESDSAGGPSQSQVTVTGRARRARARAHGRGGLDPEFRSSSSAAAPGAPGPRAGRRRPLAAVPRHWQRPASESTEPGGRIMMVAAGRRQGGPATALRAWPQARRSSPGRAAAAAAVTSSSAWPRSRLRPSSCRPRGRGQAWARCQRACASHGALQWAESDSDSESRARADSISESVSHSLARAGHRDGPRPRHPGD